MTKELWQYAGTELRELYARKQLSPVEVTEAVLRRIDAVDPDLNAYVTVTADLAVAQAKAAERDYATAQAKTLSGIPVSIKDLTMTKGIRTTRGSLLYRDWVPEQDAPVMERIVAAGAVVLGKTNSPEFGWKGETSNRVFGATHNPWQRGRTPGGSSGGGAAAVAAGLGPLAQGSDGAGSIRIPASFCGIYGLKPSWALIPQYPSSGVIQLSHLGPLSRTVGDAALFLTATAGRDDRDRDSWSSGIDYLAAFENLDLTGKRVAWTPDFGYAAIEPEVREIAGRAAQRFTELGCDVEEAHPALPDPWEIVDVIWTTGMAAVLGDRAAELRGVVDPGLLAVVESGLQRTGVELAQAFLRRSTYYEAWRAFMERYDFVLTPTLPCTAFPIGLDHPGQIAGQPTEYLSWTAFTYPFDVTGQPAASVPCGFDRAGLPVGLQIVGRVHDDVTVLRASAAFEALAPWAKQWPNITSV